MHLLYRLVLLRDPRVCPGCLGFAVGTDPDLSNISYALTSLSKGNGSVVPGARFTRAKCKNMSSRWHPLYAHAQCKCHKQDKGCESMRAAIALQDSCRACSSAPYALTNPFPPPNTLQAHSAPSITGSSRCGAGKEHRYQYQSPSC